MMASYNTADATRPAASAVTVTPSDATVLNPTRGLYVGVTGTLVVEMAEGGEATFVAAPVGYHPLQVVKVLEATGADSILALY